MPCHSNWNLYANEVNALVPYLVIFDTIDWGKSHTLAFVCTNEAKLRVFQFKFLHRKLATNCFLLKIGIKSNDQCSFCKESSETVLHLFWECPLVKSLWNEIGTWMKNSYCFLNEEFSFLSCIGLVNDTTNLLFHHALLIARYHIYFSKQKGLNPSWELFFQTILNCLGYERRYAIKTGILRKFNAKWGAFIWENDLYSLFPLSRCAENSNHANSLVALLTFLGG